MASQNKEPLTFEGGMDNTSEPSRLANGQAAELKNWEPMPDGTLRARTSWGEGTEQLESEPAVGFVYDPRTDNRLWAQDDGSGTALVLTEVDGPGPAAVSQNTIAWTNPQEYVPIEVAFGDAYITGRAEPGVRSFYANALVVGSKAGRSLTFYKNRLFSAGGDGDGVGTNTAPWRLFWTGAGDVTNWAGLGSGNTDVAKDNGQPINCIKGTDDGVLVGKSQSVFMLRGTNPTNFSLIELEGGGAVPGESIVPTPYGAYLFGPDNIYALNGNFCEPIGAPILEEWSNYYSRKSNIDRPFWLTTAYIDGRIHIKGNEEDAPYFVYDVKEGVFWREEAGLLHHLTTEADTFLYGAFGETGIIEARTRSSIHSRGDEDSPDPIVHQVVTPDYAMEQGGISHPRTPRHLYIKVRCYLDAFGVVRPPGDLEVSQYVDGALTTTQTLELDAVELKRYRLDWGKTGYHYQFILDYEGYGISIEELTVEYDRERDR